LRKAGDDKDATHGGSAAPVIGEIEDAVPEACVI